MKINTVAVVVILMVLSACNGTKNATEITPPPNSGDLSGVAIPVIPGVPIAAPAGLGVTDYVPLFANGSKVVEQVQYTEPDGTLVTYAGFRPTPRHAREGGEPWTDAVDIGPGNYSGFSTFYFQNRTFGLVIRDEIPAGRQRITAYLKPNAGILINNSFSAFRRLDPGVIEYGWKMGIGFKNPKDGSERCGPTEKIQEMCVAVWQNGATILDYWRVKDELQYQGITRSDDKLHVGDKIEMTPGVFLDHLPDSAVALIDGGQSRDYSLEQLYLVGKGFVPWYGIAPKLDTTALPDDALLGGQASVSYNYSEEPHRVFQQSVNNIGIADMQRFVEGRRLFHTSFLDGAHSENPNLNPVFSAHANQLGQHYNEVRCLGCHTLNGRSPAADIGSSLNRFAVLTAAASTDTTITPDSTYGFNVQQLSRTGGTDYTVSIQSYEKTVRTLPDGEKIELQKPVYAFKGPVPAQLSVRQAPQVIGMGLLEAINEDTILALADPQDKNGDGVRGVPNWSINPETDQRQLGRFGWKASKSSVRHQIASALLIDLGVTTPAFKTPSCQQGAADCKTSTATPSVSNLELDRLSSYLRLLGVPAWRKYASGYTDGTVTPPEHNITDATRASIARGDQLFTQTGCTSCHTAELKTGANHPFYELRNQVIHPYTDLLLHDMGSGLADTMTEGKASPSMWRTQPLWGLGSLKYVQKETGFADPQSVRYLHDGRARTLSEAIAWHGGEATNSRAMFEVLPKTDREALLVFLGSL
jgi:CxxC motif-containing protein (DUF1111 family)